MYSKAETSQLKQEFWTSFGKYLSLHLSSEGVRINWINYKTGFRYIQFRMEADTEKAVIAIELSHPDAEIRQFFYDKFTELKAVLNATLQEEWTWEQHTQENGKTGSRIYIGLPNVNVLNRADWPAIISFLKPRIIALDEFWNDAKLLFEELRSL